MTTPAPCPSCSARLKLPDTAFGKPITCPKCGARVTVPKPGEFEAVEDSGFEEVDAPAAPARARKVTARPAAAFDEADEYDDEPDDRPRRRRGAGRTPAKRGVPKWAFAAGGAALVLLLVGGGVGLWLLGALDPSPPPGFSVAKSRAGGYRVFLPGPVRRTPFLTGPDEAPVPDLTKFGHWVDEPASGASAFDVSVWSFPLPDGAAVGPGPDELFALLKAFPGWKYDNPRYTTPEVKAVTLGGRPGIEVRVRDDSAAADRDPDRPVIVDPPSGNPERDRLMREARESSAEARRERRARLARDAKSTVLLFTTGGRRMVRIELTKTNGYFEAGWVETVRASFTFL